MNRSFIRHRSKLVTVLLGLFSVLTVASLVLFPAQAFAASLAGLQFWWNIVFPAMLPYLILVRIAADYGLFRLSGNLLSPLMCRLGLPAAAGSALAAGIALGYAAGSVQAVGDRHANRSASLGTAVSGLANPVLVLVVLATVLPGKPSFFLFLLLVHYAAWLLTVLLLPLLPGLRADRMEGTAGSAPQTLAEQSAKPHNSRTFGQVLGNSVTAGLQTMLELGGIIIIFAVTSRMLQLYGIPDMIANLATMARLSLTGGAIMPFLSGLLDMHNGILALAQSPAPVPGAVYWMSALLAWGGLAVHLEVRALLRKAGARYGPYLRFRLVHVAASVALTAGLWPLLAKRLGPWPDHTGKSAMAMADPSLWPEPAGMPQIALLVAGLIVVLLLRRLFSR